MAKNRYLDLILSLTKSRFWACASTPPTIKKKVTFLRVFIITTLANYKISETQVNQVLPFHANFQTTARGRFRYPSPTGTQKDRAIFSFISIDFFFHEEKVELLFKLDKK